MKASVNIFTNEEDLAAGLAEEIVRRIRAAATSERKFSIALSGGSTPVLLYTFLGDEYSKSVPWDFVSFFWGDERCVPPESPDSNYGMAMKYFLGKTGIPHSNIHRIRGEEEPSEEAERYSGEILQHLTLRDNLPVFDLQLLGIGNDGHTASIFPGYTGLFSSGKICDVAVQPETGQKRITLTGKVINNSEAVVFLAQGKTKATLISEIISDSPGAEKYPAAHVKPLYGSLDWYLDREAASELPEQIYPRHVIL
jgi:6-phosphogluconolactonase